MAPGPYDAPQMNTTSPSAEQIFNRLQICAMTRSLRSSIASRAFTVVELVIVLAVLGLLASTLLPALAKARPNSLAFQCLNNNRRLLSAAE